MSNNPTKMELTRLKKALQTSVDGHKLIKDKQDELLRRFINMIKETNRLRIEVNKKIREFSVDAGLSAACIEQQMLEGMFIAQDEVITADINVKSLMGIGTVAIEFDVSVVPLTSAFLSTPQLAKTQMSMKNEVLPLLLKLTESEKNCHLLSKEISKLRRRVNALEHLLIPGYEKRIREISMKLEEAERENTTRMIKIKALNEEN